MRELSIVELELIVGGYDNGGGGDYNYGSSSFTYDADGNVVGTLAEADQQGVVAFATAQGFDIPIKVEVAGITVVNTKIGISKKKK